MGGVYTINLFFISDTYVETFGVIRTQNGVYIYADTR